MESQVARPEPPTRNRQAASHNAARPDMMSDRMVCEPAGHYASHAFLVATVVALFLALIVIELTPGCVVSTTGSTTGCGVLGSGVALLANSGVITFVVHVLSALPLWGLLRLMHRAVKSVYTSG